MSGAWGFYFDHSPMVSHMGLMPVHLTQSLEQCLGTDVINKGQYKVGKVPHLCNIFLLTKLEYIGPHFYFYFHPSSQIYSCAHFKIQAKSFKIVGIPRFKRKSAILCICSNCNGYCQRHLQKCNPMAYFLKKGNA